MSGPERREQLLDVTRDIVGEKGFHAVSMEAVARGAGVSRPIVYEHFATLTGLLEALVDREGGRALRQLARALPDPGSVHDAHQTLVAALRGYLDAVRSDPVTWRLVLMPPEGAPAILRDRIGAGRAQVVAQLAELVAPGLGPGLASPDPELTAQMLSALADETARLLLTDPERFPEERLVAHASWALQRLVQPAGTPVL